MFPFTGMNETAPILEQICESIVRKGMSILLILTHLSHHLVFIYEDTTSGQGERKWAFWYLLLLLLLKIRLQI